MLCIVYVEYSQRFAIRPLTIIEYVLRDLELEGTYISFEMTNPHSRICHAQLPYSLVPIPLVTLNLDRLFIPPLSNSGPLRQLAPPAMRDPPEPWLCRTILQVAAYGGHTSVVESQIAAGVAIDETDERGKTALTFASWNGHLRAVQLLLKAGADVNRMNRIDSSTALLYAVERGHTAVIVALLKAGARTDLRNQDGEFPLAITCDMAFADIWTFLA
jgi:hypothetical protein